MSAPFEGRPLVLLPPLPSDRVLSLARVIEEAGGIPLVHGSPPAGATLGSWRRDQGREVIELPGLAPLPIVDVEALREIPQAPALVLRSLEGSKVLEALERLHPQGIPLLVFAPLDRRGLSEARRRGASSFVLRESLWIFPEFDLPQEVQERLRSARGGETLLVHGEEVVLTKEVRLSGFLLKRSKSLSQALLDLRSDFEGGRPPPALSLNPLKTLPSISYPPSGEPIAVVGMGAVLPGSKSAEEFWKHVLSGSNLIREVPPSRWDPALFFDPDPRVPDKTYSKIGAFVEEIPFDPLRFRIPPAAARSIDDVQKMTLVAVDEALRDSGLDRKALNRERVAVILGNSMGGEGHVESARRVYYPEFARALRESPTFALLPPPAQEKLLSEAEERYKSSLRPITEDSMPGELANVIAGRVANAFDFLGKNCTTDAACASSLAALDLAVKGLREREFDVVITGGADRSMDPTTYTKFCKIGALSATGSRPFDAQADGFVMGEGAAVFILKRLSDALQDGDRIRAVILGVGSSSDGKGKGITAPNPRGQELAIRRALEASGVRPSEIGLVEAHGTGTPVGDVVEVEVLSKIFGESSLPAESVALGSVKSQVGHLKSAAGAVGLLKVILALENKVIPPTINVKTPNPKIDWKKTPFYLPSTPRPWVHTAPHPRRASLSSFGFGGTNFHVIVEEFVPEYHQRLVESPRNPAGTSPVSPSSPPRPLLPFVDVLLFTGPSRQAIQGKLDEALERIRSGRDLSEVARSTRSSSRLDDPVRLAVAIHGSREEIESRLLRVREMLLDPAKEKALPTQGAYLGVGPKVAGKIAFLYPGQGSQYANMGRDLFDRFPIVRETLLEAERILEPHLQGKLTELIFADPSRPEEIQKAEERLKKTEITQPAVLALDIALHRLLVSFGLNPDLVAGHSLGEYAALVAAGVLRFEEALVAVSARGAEMAHVRVPDKGKMASVLAPFETVKAVLEGAQSAGYVVAANLNSPRQTVLAGSTAGTEAAVAALEKLGVTVQWLNVSAAFHTEIVRPASEPLRRVLDRIDVRPPRIPVISNVHALPYPSDPDEIRKILSDQVASPVRWWESLERLHEMGASIFVEVGPKRALTGLVEDTLGSRGVVAVTTNHPKKGDAVSLYEAIARLLSLGIDLSLDGRPQEREESNVKIEERAQPPSRPRRPTLVVTGVSLGLPGSGRRIFDDENADRLLAGENRIERIPESLQDALLSKNVVRLVKGDGEATFQPVTSRDEVLKLAGRLGTLDLEKDYGLEPRVTETWDVTTKLAVAAGLEALRDARIPLVVEEKTTSAGTVLRGRYVLPESMQDDTGIIFASAFPGYDSLVREIERAHRTHIGELAQDLLPFLHLLPEGELRSKVARLALESSGSKREPFDRKFLFKVLSFAHAELAELLRAKGPNVQVNAACASTTVALSIAEDWIRQGRCRRVLIVASDDVTSDALFPWIGAGFLASGAATTASTVEEGALPFDRRRHGMILGSGAVGILLEEEESARERGVAPLAKLVATHVANSAYHGSRLDVSHIAREMETLLRKVEDSTGVDPTTLASSSFFLSHETYTPARGGSASAEAAALRAAFKESARVVLIANTKGFTGHPMGAGIEDALAIRALQKRKLPPVANLREIDPEFEGLTFSRGGAHDRRFAIRLSAGFGSQIAFAVFERMLVGEERIENPKKHEEFLRSLAGGRSFRVETQGRVLRVVIPPSSKSEGPESQAPLKPQAPLAASPPSPPRIEERRPPLPLPSYRREEIVESIRALISERTGYPPDVLEENADLEADLGIDTVKQAEILGALREKYGFPREDGVKVRDYSTIGKVADYVLSRIGSREELPPKGEVPASPSQPQVAQKAGLSREEIVRRIRTLISEKTGYPPDVLEENADLEADLGIDTVKQAEIFGSLRESFSLPRLEGLRIRDYGTIGKIADFFLEQSPRPSPPSTAPSETPTSLPSAPPSPLRRRAVVWGPLEEGPPREIPSPAFVLPTRNSPPLREELRLLGVPLTEDPKEALSIFASLEEGLPPILNLVQTLQRAPRLREGGLLALQGSEGAWGSALAGFAKALSREWTRTRVVALRGGAPQDLVAESRRDGPRERRISEGRRESMLLVDRPDPPRGFLLKEGDVVVATGGGAGIAAECLEALSRAVPRLKFVLSGRTPFPARPDELLSRTPEGWERRRKEVEEDLRRRGEKPTPVAVERALQNERRGAQIARTLERLKNAGAWEVRYVEADAGRKEDVKRLLSKARSLGPVRLVVHAAGVEESHLFEDKSVESFERTWRPKAQGALHLVEEAEDSAFVFFGSVAGTFGNAGQTDYSAANAFLSALSEDLVAQGRMARTIDWSAWKEVGMATRGSTLQVLSSLGIEPLPSEEGASAFVQEVFSLSNPEPEVVLSKRLGVLEMEFSRTVLWTLEGNESFLRDHVIDGVPVLPGVISLSKMIEVSGMGRAPSKAERVRWNVAVKLHRAPLTLELRTFGEPQGSSFSSTLVSTLPPIGGGSPRERAHAEALLSFGRRREAPPSTLPAVEGKPWDSSFLYGPLLFHGETFRPLSRIEGVEYDLLRATLDRPRLPDDPLLWEALLQSAGVWGISVAGVMGLPQGAQRIEWFEGGPAREVRIRALRRTPSGWLYDAEGVDERGRAVVRIEGLELVTLRPSPPAGPAVNPLPTEVRSVGGFLLCLLPLPIDEERALPLLSENEKKELEKLPQEKRRSDYLAGTLVAKEAVRQALGPLAPPLGSIEVLRDEERGRRVVLPSGTPPLGVSLSHTRTHAGAIAFPLHVRAGLDLEIVEERAPSFLSEAFRPDEDALRGGDPERETLSWCCKEAVLKAMGAGLKVDLHDLSVKLDPSGERAIVELFRDARELARRDRVEVTTGRVGPFTVYALGVLP